jgi:N-acetylmuramoyl-L-alanine amidase
MIVLHHTTGVFTGRGTVQAIQRFHMGPDRKWADIGYNFLVAPSGEVYEGRGWDYTGAHARGHNSTSIGIAYIGDGRQSVPDAAKVSILRLSVEADRRFGVLRRVGHRDVGSTVCPGDVLHAWWVSGPSLPSATPVESPVSAVRVPPSVRVAEKGEVSSQGISEPPVGDWKHRPSWVPKESWQRLIDWRNRQG